MKNLFKKAQKKKASCCSVKIEEVKEEKMASDTKVNEACCSESVS